MLLGDIHVDLRDSTVVQIYRIFYTGTDQVPLAEVIDIPKGFTFVVETKFLSPRAVDPFSVLAWLNHS